MTDNKQTIYFDMFYNQGHTCIGCAMIEDLEIEVDFTDSEIDLMRKLVSKVDEVLYCDGIMPILKDDAPELYNRIDEAARSEIYEFLVIDGIRQGYIELDEEELRRNFENDIKEGTFEFIPSDYYDLDEHPSEEELKEREYEVWLEREMRNMSIDYIRSRYSIDGLVCMENDPDYTVDIPVDFLP